MVGDKYVLNTIYATVPNCSDLIQIHNTASAGQMEVTRLDLDVCGVCQSPEIPKKIAGQWNFDKICLFLLLFVVLIHL